MIEVYFGSDQLAIHERVGRLRSELDPSGLTTTVLENARQRLPELRTACQTAGFFGAQRLVIAHDLLQVAGPKRRTTKAKTSDDDPLTILASVPDSTILCLVEREIDPTTLRAIQQLPVTAQLHRCEVPRGRELVDWVLRRTAHYEATIAAEPARILLEALFPVTWSAPARRDDVPPDMTRLDTELAKLATAVGPGGRIESTTIDQLVTGAEASNLWGVTNAISNNDPAAAAREVGSALQRGVAPETIIAQIAGQLETYAALATGEAVRDLLAVSNATGITEARLRMAARTAGRFPPTRVASALSTLRRLDRDGKLGLVEGEDALMEAAVRIAAGGD